MYFFTLPLYSQSYLELKKLGKKRKIEFFSGEEIRFKIKNDENFSMARITGIYDDYINFNNIRVNIDDIELIDIRHKSWIYNIWYKFRFFCYRYYKSECSSKEYSKKII